MQTLKGEAVRERALKDLGFREHLKNIHKNLSLHNVLCKHVHKLILAAFGKNSALKWAALAQGLLPIRAINSSVVALWMWSG